jgi:hypothetical protein
MQVTNTAFTIAEYCDQMEAGNIVVNRDYQRTDTVWPPAARSYLIETILLGYPIPKISLYQKTDLKTRRTVKEIVDGQQRSKAVLDFYGDKLRLGGKGSYSGSRYSDLEETDQQKFIGYQLSADVFVAATEADIRQMFRRINSYTVPLNPEEHRHATHQGAFKWFIVEVTQIYAETLKRLGIFSERNLSRMQDAKLFTELVLALENGIQTYAKAKLDGVYQSHDETFPGSEAVKERFEAALGRIMGWEELHNGVLMKPFNAYALLLAIMHCATPVEALQGTYPVDAAQLGPEEVILGNLGALARALEEEPTPTTLKEFADACSEATNTKRQREIRFRWFCRALSLHQIS